MNDLDVKGPLSAPQIMQRTAPAVFIHSAPRASSTYFWSKFRELPGALCFYEPFNEEQGWLTRELIPKVTYTAWESGHSPTAPYFQEYIPLVQETGGVPLYDPAMAFQWYIPRGGLRGELRPREKDYISQLSQHADQAGKTPVFGGWRTLGRAYAIKEAFGGLNILQYRNPWHQWKSILSQKRRGNLFFHVVIVDMIVRQDDPYFSYLVERGLEYAAEPASGPGRTDTALPKWNRRYVNVNRDEGTVRRLELLPEHRGFALFMGLHIYLYLHAQLSADLTADVTRMARDDSYRVDIERAIERQTGLAVSFADVADAERANKLDIDVAAIDWDDIHELARVAVRTLSPFADPAQLSTNAASFIEATIDEMRRTEAPALKSADAMPAAGRDAEGTTATRPRRRKADIATIGLCMIVKNESKVICRCLTSVLPLVDYILVVDTGSDDGTQQIIRDFLAEHDIAGAVIEEPWRNFAYNRSFALERLREVERIDYAFMIDADDTVVLDDGFDPRAFKSQMDRDLYDVRVLYADIVYARPQICSNRLPFSYKGVLHEYLEVPPGQLSRADASGFCIKITGGGARSDNPRKFQDDAALLERTLPTETDPFLISRYTFYLAQSYKDCGEKEKALARYLARAEMGFWQEEVFVALYQAARLKEGLGHPEQDVIDAYARASDALPSRAEALHGAAGFCRSKGRNDEGFQLAKRGVAIGKPNNGLFVESWIYDYGLLDELAINGYWSGHYQESADACAKILLGEAMPEHERKRILANLRFALAKLPPPSEPNLGSRGKENLLAQHPIGLARALRSRLPDPDSAPRVLVAILAKQKAKALPLYLECIEALDYPKSSIVLYIRTNNNTDQTEQILREWVDRVGHLYAGVEFNAEDVADRVEQFGVHEWNATRFRVLGRIRNISLRRALEYDCDFYFVADVDNFVRSCTLRELVALDLPIAAPLLRSIAPGSFYSNYHAEIDANGYYKECDQYHWALNRWIVGVLEMPVVHCTYLIRAGVLRDLTYEDGSARHEYVVFSDSARKSGVPQYLDNRQVYGYITFDEGDPHYVEDGLERARKQLDSDLGSAPVGEPFACRRSISQAEPEATLREKFSEIYQKNEWGYGSGVGSLPINNISYMEFVQSFLQNCGIKSVVDFGCGDWQFTRFMDWNGASYVGFDLVPSLIESNRKAFARPGVSFEVYRDIDELPAADLLLCKDVFQHLPNDTVGEYLAGFKRKFKFLLITNDDQPDTLVNSDIEAGGWRPVRLDGPPFLERAPIILSWTIDWGGWKPTHKATCLINGIRDGEYVPSLRRARTLLRDNLAGCAEKAATPTMSSDDRGRLKPSEAQSPYSGEFLDQQSAGSLASARIILQQAFRLYRPRSVLDVGCGVGPWLRAAADLGVENVLGIDGDYVPRDKLMIPSDKFRPCNLAPGPLSKAVDERFDLVICLEVAEHLSPERAASFIDELCALGDVVLFSAAIPGQGGTGHLNERWPGHWSHHFGRNGFACFDHLRSRLWADEGIEFRYAQNILFFARRGTGAFGALQSAGPPTPWPRALIHPRSGRAGAAASASDMPFSVLVPVCNETLALKFSSFYLSKLDVEPLYVLDRKASEETGRILEESGQRFTVYENDKPFIENGYDSFAAQSPTDWILRLDCDEVANLALIRLCEAFVREQRDTVIGFERDQLLLGNDELLYCATNDRFSPQRHMQPRLFNRGRVTFDKRIHTPGIRCDRLFVAPSVARIYHFSWIFSSWADRLAKSGRYDKAGQPNWNRENQLFRLEDVASAPLKDEFLTQAFVEWLGLIGEPDRQSLTTVSIR